jgi:protein translocase SecG subunit
LERAGAPPDGGVILSGLLVFFTILQILAAVAMVTVVAMQTTKSEGLTGTIGGQTSASVKVKKGSEERLREFTKWTAVTFMILSAIVALPIFRPTP